MKLHINWRSVLGYLFIVVAIGVVSVASSLIFNPEEIITARFWLIVGLKTLVSVLTFNIIYFNLQVTKKADPKSSLGLTFADYAAYVGAVYKGKHYDLVQNEIKKQNDQRRKETATEHLQNITVALDYDNIVKAREDGTLAEFIRKTADSFQLTRHERRKLRKVVKRVINGKIKFVHLDYNEIMLNNDTEHTRYPRMAVDEKTALLLKNANIVVSAGIMSALFSVFALGEFRNLFYEILSNATTIAFAIFNANMFSIQQCNLLKNAFQARKDFLCKIVDLPITKQPS